MKKAAIATAILSALVSGSSLAATVYDNDGTTLKVGGRAEARFNISDNNEKPADPANNVEGTSTFKDKSRARVNLKGKTQISNDLYGFGKYEAEFDDANDLSNRYFFAGFGTKGGEFSYGKQDAANVMISDFTDVMATFGGDAADLASGNKDKRDNNFLYAGKFGDVALKANYISMETEERDSFGVAAKFAQDNFAIGGGFVTQAEGKGADDTTQINLGGEFNTGAFSLGALLVMGEKAKVDYTAYELAAKFKANKQLSLIAVYNFGEFDKAATEEANNFAIEAVYKFNGHLRTYAGYKFEQIDNVEDQLQAGIRYDF